MNGLSMGNEIDFGVLLQKRRHPILESIDKAAVLRQPRGIEGKRQRCAGGGVVSPEVVLQKVIELLHCVQVATGRD